MVKEGQWGDLECLHKACQAAITDGGLFTDTGFIIYYRSVICQTHVGYLYLHLLNYVALLQTIIHNSKTSIFIRDRCVHMVRNSILL